MSSETKTCQNCKREFTIKPEDLEFYEKINVPVPTFCPDCRFQRRTMFRNERVFYKRTCELCNKQVITTFSPESPHTVYCNRCWWSDNWDPSSYVREYDPQKNFFEQLKELYLEVPQPALIIDYSTLVNVEYGNHIGNSKNCYLIFDTDFCENVAYATTAVDSKDSLDLSLVRTSELCYGDINCESCYGTYFSEDCSECQNVAFSKNLVGCSDCFGCINLKNKQYHIFNKPYAKEQYAEEMKKYYLGSSKNLESLKAQAHGFWEQHPHKYMRGRHNVNVEGDYVYSSKNSSHVYQVDRLEDSKFCCRIASVNAARDCYDYFEWGNNAERIYEGITVGQSAQNIKFSATTWDGVSDIEYSFWCMSSHDLFGCVGLRKKSFCILNKQYSEEEYKALKEKIIRDMDENPYTDSKDRVWKYGEFFPYDLSPFAYNETTAAQYTPLEKEEVLERGWKWAEIPDRKHETTLQPEDLPDDIKDVDPSLSKEIILCSGCGKGYYIIPMELDLLKRFGIALPRTCSECRFKERFSRITPPRSWNRTCSRCGKGIVSSYSPERPETLYCEECFNKEVIL